MKFSAYRKTAILLLFLSGGIPSPHVSAGMLSDHLTQQENEVHTICASSGATIADPTSGNTGPGMRDRICSSAQNSLVTAKIDAKLWKVWAGVAGVCGMACAVSVSGHTFNNQQYLCEGASVAGGSYDSAATKQFLGAIVGVSSAGAGFTLNHFMNKQPATPSDKNRKAADTTAAQSGTSPPKVADNTPVTAVSKAPTDYGACLQAAVAGVQTFLRHQEMTDAQAKVDNEVGTIQSLNSDTPGVVGGGGISASGGGGGGSGSVVGGGGSIGGNSPSAEHSGGGGAGGNCGGSGSQAIISCAVASDSKLPSFVKDPKFAGELQKASGQTADNFLKNDNPNSALNAAFNGSTDPALQPALASAIDALQKNTATGVEGTVYAHGAGGGGGGSAPPEPSLDKIVAGMMDQFMPKGDEKKDDTAESAIEFANKNRSPSSIMEDPTLSLFDRVTYRYGLTINRLEKLDWALPQNRLQMLEKTPSYN